MVLDSGNPYYAGGLRPGETKLHGRRTGKYVDKVFNGNVFASWRTTDLPDDAVVTHVTVIAYRGERPVLARHQDTNLLLETAVQPGEDADAAIRRVARDQAGIDSMTYRHLGHFYCETRQGMEVTSVTYRALYAADVESLLDFPADPAYERRIVPQRDFNALLHSAHFERAEEFADAIDAYLVEKIKQTAQS